MGSSGFIWVAGRFGFAFSNVEEIVFELEPSLAEKVEDNLVVFPFEYFSGTRVISVPVEDMNLD
jgi:hypothetical protein